QLFNRRGAEKGCGLADEVLPELAWNLRLPRWGAEAHQRFLEPLALERAGEGLLDDEQDAVAAFTKDPPDADAVVGRPEGALRKENDRSSLARHRRSPRPLRLAPMVAGAPQPAVASTYARPRGDSR